MAWPATEFPLQDNQTFENEGLSVRAVLDSAAGFPGGRTAVPKNIKMQFGPDGLLKTKGKLRAERVDPDG